MLKNYSQTLKVELGVPHRVIVFGDGLQTWSPVTLEHFKYCPRVTEEQLEGEVNEMMQNPGYYYADTCMDGQAIMVMRCPNKVKTKEDVRTWIEWWLQVLNEWNRGRITVLVSPSKK